MLKSSPALDGFHSILKMKRRVAGGGGGWVVCAEVEGGDMREMREPFGKKKKGGKQNVRTTAIPPQPCNTAIILEFTIHSLGEKEWEW